MPPESDERPAHELVQRAIALNGVADYPSALETATRAVELDPTNAEAHRVRAKALENLGADHLEEAMTAYERSVALGPAGLRSRTALAELLRRAGRSEEAERLYRAVADDAATAAASAANGTCPLEMAGWSQYRLGDLDGTIVSFRSALEIDDDLIPVRFDLALALLAAGQAADAHDTYEGTIARLRLADAAHRLAPLTVAAEDVEEALTSYPSIVDLPETETIRALLKTELRELATGGDAATD